MSDDEDYEDYEEEDSASQSSGNAEENEEFTGLIDSILRFEKRCEQEHECLSFREWENIKRKKECLSFIHPDIIRQDALPIDHSFTACRISQVDTFILECLAPIVSVSFSPSHTLSDESNVVSIVLSTPQSSLLQLWDLVVDENNSPSVKFKYCILVDSSVSSLAFHMFSSVDERRCGVLACTREDGATDIYSVPREDRDDSFEIVLNQYVRISIPNKKFTCCEWNCNDDSIFLGTSEGSVCSYLINDRDAEYEYVCVFEVKHFFSMIHALKLEMGLGRLLLISSIDDGAGFIDIMDHSMLLDKISQLKGRGSGVSVAVGLPILAFASHAETVYLVHSEYQNRKSNGYRCFLAKTTGAVWDVALNASGNILVTAEDCGKIRVSSINEGKISPALKEKKSEYICLKYADGSDSLSISFPRRRIKKEMEIKNSNYRRLVEKMNDIPFLCCEFSHSAATLMWAFVGSDVGIGFLMRVKNS